MKRSAHFRFRLLVAEEYQPITSVPMLRLLGIWGTILLTLALQVRLSVTAPPPKADAIALPDAPHTIVMHTLAAGDPVAFGKAVSIWLQAFDNQQGQSISFLELDYNKVAAWLGAIVALDERAQYPLFSAARIYTYIENPGKVRVMIEFIKTEFIKDPDTRWEWMATAATLAKNEVNDLDLALEYARLLRKHTLFNPEVPNWAKQMEGFLLSDKNAFDEAADFILQLLDSGEVTDPQEFQLLLDRLEDIIKKMIEGGQVKDADQLQLIEDKLEKVRAEYLRIAGFS